MTKGTVCSRVPLGMVPIFRGRPAGRKADSISNQLGVWASWSDDFGSAGSVSGTNCDTYAAEYNMDDSGSDSPYGTAANSSDSYAIDAWEYSSDGEQASGGGTGETFHLNVSTETIYSFGAEGTDSFSAGHDQSTMSFDGEYIRTLWSVGSISVNAYTDGTVTVSDYQGEASESTSESITESGWITESGGSTALFSEAVATGFEDVFDCESYAGGSWESSVRLRQ